MGKKPLLQLQKQQLFIVFFIQLSQPFKQSFIENVVNTDLKVHKNLGGSDPKIIIYSGNTASLQNTLIQFRYRTDAREIKEDNKYIILMRSYVESGYLLYKL